VTCPAELSSSAILCPKVPVYQIERGNKAFCLDLQLPAGGTECAASSLGGPTPAALPLTPPCCSILTAGKAQLVRPS
jgi:hypothetical protein